LAGDAERTTLEAMRATLFAFVVVAGCAGVQRPAAPSYSASYEVDANSMVPIVMDTTRAQHLRVAVIEQPHADRANFVALTGDGPDRTALVIHLATVRDSERFADCLGTCRSSIFVTPIEYGVNGAPDRVGDGASDAAKQRARDLLTALTDQADRVRQRPQ
jgi:hypothetical protein